MNDGAGFLKALAENPDDDTTRLVYADWLEEQGDQRAEYLRLEIRMANVGVRGTAATPEHAMYQECSDRLLILRDQIEPSWVDTAGRRYNVVLKEYKDRGLDRIRRNVRELLGEERKKARKLIEQRPCIVLPGLPFWTAQNAAWKIQGSQCPVTGEMSLSNPDLWTQCAIAYPVITPPPHLLGKPIPREFTSMEEWRDAAIAEAVLLGMTVDMFIRRANINNRVMRLMRHWD